MRWDGVTRFKSWLGKGWFLLLLLLFVVIVIVVLEINVLYCNCGCTCTCCGVCFGLCRRMPEHGMPFSDWVVCIVCTVIEDMTGHDRTCIPVLTGCTVPYRVSSYLLGSDFVTIQQEESKGPPGGRQVR